MQTAAVERTASPARKDAPTLSQRQTESACDKPFEPIRADRFTFHRGAGGAGGDEGNSAINPDLFGLRDIAIFATPNRSKRPGSGLFEDTTVHNGNRWSAAVFPGTTPRLRGSSSRGSARGPIATASATVVDVPHNERSADVCAPSDVCEPGRVGHDFSKVAIHRHGPERIQAKLVVSEPGDAYEREADRVADTVMHMPGPATSSDDDAPAASATTTHSVLRARRAVETDATVGTRRVSPPGTLAISRVFDGEREAIGRMGAPGRLRARIGARRGRGKPLAESARSFLEPRFGRELGHLRIHADSEADSLSRSLKARAFTVGRDIFFREGEYRPATERGRRLLAHEVTHTLQQYPVPAMTSISATASSVPVHPESSTPNVGAMPRVARHGTAGTDTAIAGELDRVPTRVFRSAVATWEAASEDDRESILIGETQKEDVRSRDIWKAKRRLRRYRRQQKRREAVASLKNKEHLSRKDKRKLQNKKAYLKWANAWGLTVESPRVDKILTIHANYHYFETFNVGGAAVRIDEGILDDVARMFRIGETPDFWPGIRWTDSSGKEREIGVRFDLGFIPKKPSGDSPAVNAQQFPTELMQDESVQKGKAENVLAAIPIDELYTRDDLEQIWAFLDDEGMTDSFSLETRTAYTLGADPEQVDFERLKAKLLKDIDTRPDPKSQRSDLKKAVEASTSFDTLMDALTSPHEIELAEVGMSDTEIIAYTTPDGERREFDETQLNALKEAIRAEWRRQGRSMETLEGDVAGYGGRKTVGVDWERTQRAKQHPRYQKLSEDELMEKNLSSSQVATYYDNTRQIPQELVTIPANPRRALAAVIAHEIGHNIGMAHADQGIMDAAQERRGGLKEVKLNLANPNTNASSDPRKLVNEVVDLSVNEVIHENIQRLVNRIPEMTRAAKSDDVWSEKIPALLKLVESGTASAMETLFSDPILPTLLLLPEPGTQHLSSIDTRLISEITADGRELDYSVWERLSVRTQKWIRDQTRAAFVDEETGRIEGTGSGTTTFENAEQMEAF